MLDTIAIHEKVQDRIDCRHAPSFKHGLTESELDFSKMPAASRQFCHCYRKDMNHEVRESENPRHLHSTGIAAGTSDHIRNHDRYQSGDKDVISHLFASKYVGAMPWSRRHLARRLVGPLCCPGLPLPRPSQRQISERILRLATSKAVTIQLLGTSKQAYQQLSLA